MPAGAEKRVDPLLLAWAGVLREHGNDWDSLFEKRSAYFTPAYRNLFVACVLAARAGRAMTLGEACQVMNSGSSRTREERIRRALADGHLIRIRGAKDGRAVLVLPTKKLEAAVLGHLERTLERAMKALGRRGVPAGGVKARTGFPPP
jgi:hypothetical protein